MITCYIRYTLNLDQLDAFAEYGRIWIDLINRLGGTHHGYFLPSQEEQAQEQGRFSFQGLGSEGPTNIGIAVFSFPDWRPMTTIGQQQVVMRNASERQR